MNQEKDRRINKQHLFKRLVFEVVEGYGYMPGDEPVTKLMVNLVPATVERLLAAQVAVTHGVVDVAGAYIRSSDVQANSRQYHFGEVCLFLLPSSKARIYTLKLHCFCHLTGVFITADKEMSGIWFEEQQALHDALDEGV